MRKGTEFGVILLCSLYLCACSSNKMGPKEYVQAVHQDKQLNKQIKIGKILYTFSMVTPEMTALKAAQNSEGHIDPSIYQQRLKELKDHLLLHIHQQVEGSKNSVLKYNLKEPAEYEQRVMYYEFYAKNDIKLLSNGKELAPEAYQYENHMDLAPHNTIVVSFPKEKNAKEWQVVFNDRPFNNLFIKVNFTQEDINELPRLVLN